MVTPMAYYNLLDACENPGCPVCQLLQRDANHTLDALFYENANDPDSHRTFRKSRGLCNTHGWQLERFVGYSLGTSVLYRAALNEVLMTIENKTQGIRKANGKSLADALEPTDSCMVCDVLRISEPTYIKVFFDALTETKFRSAFGLSDGLCLPHLRQLLQKMDRLDTEPARVFLEIQQGIWKRLEQELRVFEDKSMNDRMHEQMGKEGDSWKRVIGAVSGGSEVFGLEPRPRKR